MGLIGKKERISGIGRGVRRMNIIKKHYTHIKSQ